MADHEPPGSTPGVGARVRGVVRALRTTPPLSGPSQADVDVPEMLGEIAVTLLAASQATSDVEGTLKNLAVQYGRPDLSIIVLPTMVFIESRNEPPGHTYLFSVEGPDLRLDQSGAVDQMVQRAFRERQEPQTVVDALRKITDQPPRFGPALVILGHALLSLGFGLMLNPTATALPVYALLGLFVGTVVHFGNRLSTLALILPVAASFTATVLVSLVTDSLVNENVIRLVTPALVSFLPGLMLTIATVELTSGQVIAGASRLVYGVARLGMLTFGVYAGMMVVPSAMHFTGASHPLGGWAPWAGLLLVSVGYYFYSGAPRGSLLWILYAIIVAYSAQLLGHLIVGSELSGLLGALIMIPAVHLAARLRAAAPSIIMLTCGYWVLVPGAMGFTGMSEAASGSANASTTMLQTAASLLSIAIGMMLGTALSRDARAVAKGWSSPEDTASALTEPPRP